MQPLIFTFALATFFSNTIFAQEGYEASLTPKEHSAESSYTLTKERCHQLEEKIKSAEESGSAYGTWDEIPQWKAEKIQWKCSHLHRTSEKQN